MSSKPEAVFYLLPTRGWELLTGALLTLRLEKARRRRVAEELLGWAGTGLILIGVLSYRPDFHFPGTYALLPVSGAACILMAGESGRSSCTRVLSTSPIVYVGRLSYSLYLVHWPIEVFARSLIRAYTLEWRFGMFALSFLLAAAIYHGIEKPVRARRFLGEPRRLLQGYVTGIAATATAVGLVLLLGGWPQRFPPEVARLAAFVNDRAPPLTECEFGDRSTTLSPCAIGAPGVSPIWLVYGDSHAWAAHAAFDQWLKSPPRSRTLHLPTCLSAVARDSPG